MISKTFLHLLGTATPKREDDSATGKSNSWLSGAFYDVSMPLCS
jgi:hypothetical protein